VIDLFRKIAHRILDRRQVAPSRRDAQAYEKAGFVILGAHARTDEGVLIPRPPAIRIACDAPPEELGRAVRAVLAEYRDGVPHPQRWAGVGQDFLKATGLKSWRALMSGARYCGIVEEPDGSISFGHYRQVSAKQFVPLGIPDRVLAAGAPDDEVGAALLEALAASE